MSASLATNLMTDTTSALSAAWMPAAMVGCIDKACTQNLAGTNTMKASLQNSVSTMFKSPHRWLVSWECVHSVPVYYLTYFTVNMLDSYFEKRNGRNDKALHASNEVVKVSTVCAVNVSISIWKDRMFARKYGAILASGLPARSYLVFLMRDAGQMFCTFSLPSVVTKYVGCTQTDPIYAKLQLTVPMANLLPGVYLHLLGLDIYNRRQLRFLERQRAIFKAYPATVMLFVFRTFWPFCVGPYLNSTIRRSMESAFEEEDENELFRPMTPINKLTAQI